jgi:hypothetical protein
VVKTNQQMIMKSEKKLQQAIRQLDWVTTLSLESQRSCVSEVKRLLHEFMVDNERTPKKGEFNIWDWVANDELRPVMEGVFHDKENKVAVATNAHMLVVDAASYDESKTDSVGFDSGKQKFDRPINKYGEYIDGRFPNYQAVIPQQTDEWTLHHVNLQEFDEYIKKCNAYCKMQGWGGKYKPISVYKVGDVWFHAERLRLMLTATDGDVCVKTPDRPAVYWSSNRTALIMPMLVEDKKLMQEEKENGMYFLEI